MVDNPYVSGSADCRAPIDVGFLRRLDQKKLEEDQGELLKAAARDGNPDELTYEEATAAQLDSCADYYGLGDIDRFVLIKNEVNLLWAAFLLNSPDVFDHERNLKLMADYLLSKERDEEMDRAVAQGLVYFMQEKEVPDIASLSDAEIAAVNASLLALLKDESTCSDIGGIILANIDDRGIDDKKLLADIDRALIASALSFVDSNVPFMRYAAAQQFYYSSFYSQPSEILPVVQRRLFGDREPLIDVTTRLLQSLESYAEAIGPDAVPASGIPRLLELLDQKPLEPTAMGLNDHRVIILNILKFVGEAAYSDEVVAAVLRASLDPDLTVYAIEAIGPICAGKTREDVNLRLLEVIGSYPDAVLYALFHIGEGAKTPEMAEALKQVLGAKPTDRRERYYMLASASLRLKGDSFSARSLGRSLVLAANDAELSKEICDEIIRQHKAGNINALELAKYLDEVVNKYPESKAAKMAIDLANRVVVFDDLDSALMSVTSDVDLIRRLAFEYIACAVAVNPIENTELMKSMFVPIGYSLVENASRSPLLAQYGLAEATPQQPLVRYNDADRVMALRILAFSKDPNIREATRQLLLQNGLSTDFKNELLERMFNDSCLVGDEERLDAARKIYVYRFKSLPESKKFEHLRENDRGTFFDHVKMIAKTYFSLKCRDAEYQRSLVTERMSFVATWLTAPLQSGEDGEYERAVALFMALDAASSSANENASNQLVVSGMGIESLLAILHKTIVDLNNVNVISKMFVLPKSNGSAVGKTFFQIASGWYAAAKSDDEKQRFVRTLSDIIGEVLTVERSKAAGKELSDVAVAKLSFLLCLAVHSVMSEGRPSNGVLEILGDLLMKSASFMPSLSLMVLSESFQPSATLPKLDLTADISNGLGLFPPDFQIAFLDTIIKNASGRSTKDDIRFASDNLARLSNENVNGADAAIERFKLDQDVPADIRLKQIDDVSGLAQMVLSNDGKTSIDALNKLLQMALKGSTDAVRSLNNIFCSKELMAFSAELKTACDVAMKKLSADRISRLNSSSIVDVSLSLEILAAMQKNGDASLVPTFDQLMGALLAHGESFDEATSQLFIKLLSMKIKDDNITDAIAALSKIASPKSLSIFLNALSLSDLVSTNKESAAVDIFRHMFGRSMTDGEWRAFGDLVAAWKVPTKRFGNVIYGKYAEISVSKELSLSCALALRYLAVPNRDEMSARFFDAAFERNDLYSVAIIIATQIGSGRIKEFELSYPNIDWKGLYAKLLALEEVPASERTTISTYVN